MKAYHKPILALLFFITVSSSLHSQQTIIYEDPIAGYQTALDLFNKEKYVAARDKFLEVSDQLKDQSSLLKSTAEYYAAVCGFELFNNNADQTFSEFLETTPANTRHLSANLQLGKLEYRKNNFRKSIQYLEAVQINELRGKERDEYFFKMGYSFLRINDNSKASKAFERISGNSSTYFSASEYYLAHILYTEKKYDQSLVKFQALKDDAVFKNIVPFYIAQIYYKLGNFEELLVLAPTLLQTSNTKRIPEIARMTGEALYQAKKYSEALPYLELYQEKTKLPLNRIDYYELGYTYYKTQNCDKAIEQFNKAVSESDSLSQDAFYHLGDCYVRKGQKKFALNSFYSAYKEGFDKEIREDALFNYAKLSYELGYNPYNEAIKALKQYLQEYPESRRIDEAYTYLVNLFMSTKNYKDAIGILDNIKTKNEKLKAAYLRLSYLYGIEVFNSGDYKASVDWFKKVADNNYDREISASSWYWIGEAKYRLGNYDEAASKYRQFLTTPGAFSLEFYRDANYNLGYCYFKQKEYDKSLTEFRKYIAAGEKNDPKLQNDALLRAGDCFFVLKRYEDAIIQYDLASKMRKSDGDYAFYQKALALGAAGRPKEKTEALKELMSIYPKSNLVDEAKYELGLTYLSIGDETNALTSFKRLVEEHPGNKLVKNALLRLGLIYYNTDNDQEALKTFRKVVSDYPGTSESKEALVSIRNIYVDLNKVDDFFVYAKSIPFANVSNAEQDSITYQAAENQYMAGDCNSSGQGFKNYLDKFQQGIFRLNANFYLAECLFRQNRTDEAVPFYQYVISNSKSKFTETALVNVANYNFSKKEYDKALNSFTSLEASADNPANQLTALTGIMRCNYQLKKYDSTIIAGKKLVGAEKISTELLTEAHLTMAKSAFDNNQTSLAQTEFEATYKLTKGEKGAEAKYYLALLQFNQGNYKETEKMVFEFINEFSAYDAWLARNFILLSDVYVKLGNIVQAKQTLQSIIDNYDGSDLVEIAHQKLNAINDAEKAEIQKKEDDVRKAKEAELNNETESLINENK